MTVAELITKLAAFEPDLRVMIDGYEGGFEDLQMEGVVPKNMWLDANKHILAYFGPHEDYEHDGCAVVPALVLTRRSGP